MKPFLEPSATLMLSVAMLIPSVSPFILQSSRIRYTSSVRSSSSFTSTGDGDGASTPPSLKGATILVCGANGFVGSRVVRNLLRMPDGPAEVRAVVRDAGKLESFSRLSYEIGAEEGKGTISPVWVTRDVSFEGTEEMKGYGLGKVKVLSGDLLDSAFVKDAVSGCDSVVYCAAPDSNPLASLAPDALFKKLLGSRDTMVDGSVEAEGVQLVATSLSMELKRRNFRSMGSASYTNAKAASPTAFVLLSAAAEKRNKQRKGEDFLRASAGLPSWVVVRAARLSEDDYNDYTVNPELSAEEKEAAVRLIPPPEVVGVVDQSDGAGTLAADGSQWTSATSLTRGGCADFLVNALTDVGLRGKTVAIAAVAASENS